MGLKNLLKDRIVSERIDDLVDTMPKPVGSFGYDPWGFNEDNFKIGLGVMKNIYEKYFRVEAYGLENIPAHGRVLIIPNHSGQLPIDGGLIGYALATNEKAPRAARAMVERFLPGVPFIGNIINSIGAVIGDPINCVKMLREEEAVIVFPEGVRGTGKLFKDRYKLARFGNGFMHIAITEKTPIVPVGVVGCEETMPSIGNIKTLAKMLSIPYFPITTPVPLPCKVRIYFGKPMMFEGEIENEAEIVKKVEIVKDAIRDLIDEGLKSRENWFA